MPHPFAEVNVDVDVISKFDYFRNLVRVVLANCVWIGGLVHLVVVVEAYFAFCYLR